MITGARAGAVCAAFNNRVTDKIISYEDKHPAEERTITAAMETLLAMG